MPKTVDVIINSNSGGFVAEETLAEIERAFAGYSVEVRVHVADTGDETEKLAAECADSEGDIIVAAGGDGTISTVAKEVVRAGKVLGILPLGTLNNFSKDLQIPQDIDRAIRTIVENSERMIDLGEVNGRIFVNNSSIGLYPHIVRDREKQQRLGRGKWLSAFWASLRIFKRSPFLKVELEIDGKKFLRKTPFVFVGNNSYEMEIYNIGRRKSLETGELSVYYLHREGRWGLIMLILKTALGSLKQWEDFEYIATKEITIFTRKNLINTAIDGETTMMETPLTYKIRPRALRVLVPAETK
jgi:YegS/Rv2252/BmrU family lipid kinase